MAMTSEGINLGKAARKAQAHGALAAMGVINPDFDGRPIQPAPRVMRDLPIPCPGCGRDFLTGVRYHAFVNETRLMVWCEGVCPACQLRQPVIWDPLPPESAEALLKAGGEIEALVRDWVAQLEEPLVVEEVA